MRMNLAVALAALALVGCETPVDQASVDYSRQALYACFQEKADALDDGQSDVQSVGRAVATACGQEIQYAIGAATSGQSGYYGASFAETFRAEAPRRAAVVVLERRAARRPK